jgi:hypothetical protein
MGFTPPSVKPEAVAGAPYSGEEEYEQNGSVTKGRLIYRDSEGRVRTERPMAPGGKRQVVEIIDPVLGCHWVLDTQNKIAHLMKPQPPPLTPGAVPAPPPMPTAPTGPSVAPPQPKVTNEQLEGRLMDGVSVAGNRSTTVYPDGRTVIGESWMSSELKILVMTRMGDQTFRIARLSRAEPHPSLFRVPSDYTIVEETGTFLVEYR